ncbi:MAG TPA: DUF2281 domain-containing protein [Caldilineae bacterium]|nr:DUF2281 domain-containing protein [Caldilineae bacterium]
MSTMIVERTELHQTIDLLPDEALGDLSDVVKNLVAKYQTQKNGEPPFRPVHFPEGISKGDDVSIEDIRQMRREVWANFPREF